jgi:hypothetical protein
MRITIAQPEAAAMRGTMAFALWSCVTHGGVTAVRDGLAMVMLHGSSSIFVRFAFVWELAYLFEILLGAAAAVLGAIGVLRCFGRNALCPGPALIAEKCTFLSVERQTPREESSERNAEVPIRLDDRHFWPLRRHRCVVTFQTSLGGAQIAGREVWYAKGEKSHR